MERRLLYIVEEEVNGGGAGRLIQKPHGGALNKGLQMPQPRTIPKLYLQ